MSDNSNHLEEGQITYCVTEVIEDNMGGVGWISISGKRIFWSVTSHSTNNIDLKICPENTMSHLQPERLEQHVVSEAFTLWVPFLVYSF